jgi:hypothetical protein
LRVYLPRRVAFWSDWNLVTRSLATAQKNASGLCSGLLAWERDERRPPPQIRSFLPPCLHSKPMTSGVSGGSEQPIGAERRTDRALSPFCCSGQSATKEGRCASLPIHLPGPRPGHCHRASHGWPKGPARSELLRSRGKGAGILGEVTYTRVPRPPLSRPGESCGPPPPPPACASQPNLAIDFQQSLEQGVRDFSLGLKNLNR